MALNNAHNFGINNLNTFTAKNVNMFSSQSQSITRHPEDILNDARAVEATHTSPIASHASKCNPKTRIQVIGDIVKWVTTPHSGEPPKSALWFPGPAGAGKTCIMRSVVGQCEEAGLLVASYFFSTRSPGLRHERPFMATIAHQLSIDPTLKPMILEAIRQRPTIFQESLDLQMNKLVISPLTSYPSGRILVVVDGLDECSNKPQRKHLLELLQTLAHALPTISIIIASRPEQDIRATFEKQDFTDIAHILRLESYDAMDDTRIFVCDEFEKIRRTHPMKRSLRQDWPTEDGVGILLGRSSGIFIVCSIAMKYIANPRRDPVKSLEEVLALWSRGSPSSRSRNGKPLEELDLLYNLILHPPDSEMDLVLMKRLLHCLIGLLHVGDRTMHSFLASLLGLPLGAIDIALCDLHSVLAVPENHFDNIQFHHKSLQDHLLSPGRSLDMFQEPYETHLDLTLCFFHRFQAWARNPSVDVLDDHSPLALPLECQWGAHLKAYFLYKPPSVPPPNAFLQFDPRIIWRFWFAYGISTDLSTFVDEYQKVIHQYVCAGGPCSQICNTFAWMGRCSGKVANLIGNQTNPTIQGLDRFDIESGLYDPNAQFTTEPGESRLANFPGFGAYHTFPSSPRVPVTKAATATIESPPLTRRVHPDGAQEPTEVHAHDLWHSIRARFRRFFQD